MGTDGFATFSTFFITVILLLGVVFIIRNVICWYFKINALIEQNEKIIDLLTKIETKLN